METVKLEVEVFKGKEASVNSYIFNNGKSIVVMDVFRNSAEAAELTEVLKTKSLPVTHLLISHGHPDHYIGMDVLSKAFPDAKIVVPSAEIKADIIGFSTWMESVGWLDGEPLLKPKSATNPNGFDYEGKIGILNADHLELHGGGRLDINTNYPAAEAEHLSTVYSKDLNALFTSDFCYNGVHLWLGQGVDQAHINHWKNQLNTFKTQYAGSDITIYPGHGSASTVSLFDTVLTYINTFEQTIASSASKEEAMDNMKAAYPDWEQADFLLLYSVDYHIGLKAEQ